MPLAELMPFLKELSQSEKLLLINYLTAELLEESGLVPLNSHNKVASQGLHDSFEAAAVLAKALAEGNTATHG